MPCALQSGLIAATDAQLLVFMRAPVDGSDPLSVHHTTREVMLLFIYTGLFFSMSATVSQLIMTETVAELPVNAAHASSGWRAPGPTTRPRDVIDRLVAYGVSREVKYVSLHCEFSLLIVFAMGSLSDKPSSG